MGAIPHRPTLAAMVAENGEAGGTFFLQTPQDAKMHFLRKAMALSNTSQQLSGKPPASHFPKQARGTTKWRLDSCPIFDKARDFR